MQSLKLLPGAAILCGHSCSSIATPLSLPASKYEAKQQVMPQPVLSCLPKEKKRKEKKRKEKKRKEKKRKEKKRKEKKRKEKKRKDYAFRRQV